MERARDLGAAGYLVKPVTLEQLRTVIAETGSIGLYEEGGRCALRLRYASPGA
jgi:two-component SAPR family response regulator